MGGIKDQILTKNDGNKVIQEKVTQPCREMYEIFVSLQQVQPKKDMKQARSMFAAAHQGSLIFAVGGINSEKNEMKECESYDIKLNQWT